jgi:hypothetical protein
MNRDWRRILAIAGGSIVIGLVAGVVSDRMPLMVAVALVVSVGVLLGLTARYVLRRGRQQND